MAAHLANLVEGEQLVARGNVQAVARLGLLQSLRGNRIFGSWRRANIDRSPSGALQLWHSTAFCCCWHGMQVSRALRSA